MYHVEYKRPLGVVARNNSSIVPLIDLIGTLEESLVCPICKHTSMRVVSWTHDAKFFELLCTHEHYFTCSECDTTKPEVCEGVLFVAQNKTPITRDEFHFYARQLSLLTDNKELTEK